MQDLIVYDGKGNAVNPFTVSVNGTISTPTAIGTSTVNSDCTGTLSQTGGNYNFVVAADGSKLFWIEIDPNTVISGSAFRLGHADFDYRAALSPLREGGAKERDLRRLGRVPPSSAPILRASAEAGR